ncbi:L-lactate dehydrogenase complex protein LldE [Micromonospora pattaloongensis]|uniref:L-lactate dehydrogenase complex protein LldE n=1 Tax=Micromonospora pattaloongensis TaxID=405436 RepID=A0A1H3FPE6_9ACTN|nr:(Fe-S)-binding protein [Micromonospora pattaloongensis]SDX92004.1 L-lactate dehydrogenase complex protein LldE [Micromonospora pattaloongensis]
MRIALFVTCVNDLMFPRTGQAVVRILERLGHRVEFPEAQSCCGQMHANSGYRAEALPLLRGFVDTFAPYDAVVAPSGSCVAMVRESYPRLAAGDAELSAAVAALAPRTYELSELLVDVLGVTDVGAHFPHRVTYHPTCHGLRMLRLGDRPQRLLRTVRGLELVELPGGEECCGFGGTFAMKNADVSAAMLADKCAAIRGTGAGYVAAADNSCLAHIGGGLSRGGGGVSALHYAEILAGLVDGGKTDGAA